MARMAQKTLAVFDALGHERADRRIAILRQIGALGSISQAARSAGVSYKAAWQAIDTLTNLAGVPLVERVVGGVGGGGARLTDAARELLAAAEAMHRARGEVALGLARQGKGHAALAQLAVRTSMRNQWPCTVCSVQRQGPLALVDLQGPGGALALQARLTRESAELLGLAAGLAVQVLCKATAVQVYPAAQAQPGDQPNHWPGRVRRVARGPLGDEVAVQLDGGLQLVGFAPPGSGLRARSAVVASAQPSALALMLAD
ncbi:TOBE domain-containing protein [Comamonas flocculans]